MMERTHKQTGWKRIALGGGHWQIVPTDASGDRTVAFLSAGSWQNLPGDDRAQMGTDRVVLVSGEPLPDWALAWLTTANAKSCRNGREAFRAALDDADDHAWRDTGW